MPLPDGTSSALEISQQLDRLLFAFKPLHKPGTDMWDRMTAEYATALCRFPPRSLKAGITHLIATRKEKFWPLPAEIIAAIEAVVGDAKPAMPVPRRLSVDEIRAQLEAENQAMRDAKRDLREDFQRDHASLYRQADIEGWRSHLDTAVRAAANILAQRNSARAAGKSVREPHEFPNIGWVDGVERICIGPEEIAQFQWLSGDGKTPPPKSKNSPVDKFDPQPGWSDEPALARALF